MNMNMKGVSLMIWMGFLDSMPLAPVEEDMLRFANDNLFSLVEMQIDLYESLKDEYNPEYLFPTRKFAKEPEKCIDTLYELRDTIQSDVIYNSLPPLQKYVLYNLMEIRIDEYKHYGDDFRFKLPDRLKERIREEYVDICGFDQEPDEAYKTAIEILESPDEYIPNCFEDTDFLEEDLRKYVWLAINNKDLFLRTMSYEELDGLIEVMPGDIARQYTEFRKKQAVIGQALKKEDSSRPTVFLSYNHKSDIVDELESRLSEIADVRRDKNSLGYWDNLTAFMNSIRKADFAVLVISDWYLKYVPCMYEVMQLMKDEGWNQRVMYIVEDNARGIYKVQEQLDYIKYWKEKEEKLAEELKALDPAETMYQAEELRKIRLIKLHIGELIEKVCTVNNPDAKDAIAAVVNRVLPSSTGNTTDPKTNNDDNEENKKQASRHEYNRIFAIRKLTEDEFRKEEERQLENYIFDPEDPLCGSWEDIVSQRCHMEIYRHDGKYFIRIQWASSAWEYHEWSMSGEWNEKMQAICCTDECSRMITGLERGNTGKLEITTLYNNGISKLFFHKRECHWLDASDTTGYRCRFVKMNNK